MEARKLIPVDIGESPELARIADEVERSGVGRLLPVAVIQPLAMNERVSLEKHGYLPEDDPLLEIIGMFDMR